MVTGYGMGVEHDGGFAEYVRVPADWVVPLPQGLTLFEAMAIGTAGFTAALSIHRLEQNELYPGKRQGDRDRRDRRGGESGDPDAGATGLPCGGADRKRQRA